MCLIFDDTIVEKAYIDENEIICRHYDHGKKCRKEKQSYLRIEKVTENDDNTRSCPHGGYNISKAGDFRSNGHLKRENGYRHFPTGKMITNKAVLGKSLLEPQLLCHNGRMDQEKIQRYVKYKEDAERQDEDHELRDGPC